MDNRTRLLVGFGLGAVAMYYLDPARGRRRRALVGNQVVHATHRVHHGVGVVGRDMRNRIVGRTAALRSLLDSSEPDDVVLAERVRACLGRAVTHPSSIHVETSDGLVTLSGPILRHEVALLMDSVRAVPGVKHVRDRLELHTEPGRIPGLQGTSRRRSGQRAEFMQANWSPSARAAGGVAGAMAVIHGFNHKDLPHKIMGMAGLLLMLRAATNLELRRLLGIGVPRRAVDIQKHIQIHAPVEKVFRLWDHFEGFPSCTTHVRRVRRLDDHRGKDRWRWTIRGPAGLETDCDIVVTTRAENRLLAWRTEDGSLIQHAGRVLFQPLPGGSTRVDIHMTYNPVAGAVGHALAWLIGADPKHQMDQDLMRIKTFLESGHLPRDAAEHDVDVERMMLEGSPDGQPAQDEQSPAG